MNRWLYVLVAAAVASVTPPPVSADAVEIDSVEETISVIETAPGARPRSGSVSSESSATVVVWPLPPDEALLQDHPAPTLLVERGGPDIAVIHGDDPAATLDHVASSRLIDAALRDAVMRGELKVVIESPLPLDRLRDLCERNRFIYWRTVTRDERTVHEFLADLYTAPRESLTLRSIDDEVRA